MSIVETDIEQIWQTIEALPPEGREIIRERLGHEKPSRIVHTTSPSMPLEDKIFTLSFDEYLSLSDEERASIRTSFYTKYRDWIDNELQRRQAEWMLIVGGQIIETGQLDEYPSRNKIFEVGHKLGWVPFVFVANPIIEESQWVALPRNDFYPTVSIIVSSDDLQSTQKSLTLQADLDTGTFNILFDYDNFLKEQLINSQPLDDAHDGFHLGKIYYFHVIPATVSISDETGKTVSRFLSVLYVRNWQQSPLCIVNPLRKALVGRKLLLRLPIRIELNGQDHTTKIFALS